MSGPAAPLDLERLGLLVESGDVDTVLLAIADMQGRLQGKRLHARYFLRRGPGPRHRGLQLPARRRRRHEHRRRLRDVVLGRRGYGDFVMQPDLATLRPVPWQPGTAMVLADLALGGRQPRRRLAAPDPAPADGPARRARAARRSSGTELEFIVFRDTYEEAWDARLPRPAPGQPVQRRLLDARHGPDRAAAAPDPQRDGRRRPARRVGQGRVQPRPARDRLPLRRGAGDLRQPRRSTRTAPRRSPPRRAWR